jgi:hypothetical protein
VGLGARVAQQILEQAMVELPGGYSTEREVRWKAHKAFDAKGDHRQFAELSHDLLNKSEDYEGLTLDHVAELYVTTLTEPKTVVVSTR